MNYLNSWNNKTYQAALFDGTMESVSCFDLKGRDHSPIEGDLLPIHTDGGTFRLKPGEWLGKWQSPDNPDFYSFHPFHEWEFKQFLTPIG